MRLLIVEDDDRTARHLVRGLSESGHVVDRAADGEIGLALASEGIYDALIVDRRLPILDGLTLVQRLRERDTSTPVLMLSAIGGTADRVEGMRAGCDDYLAKPYAFAEVLARLEALARRADRSRRLIVLRVGDLALDTQARAVSRDGVEIPLRTREFLLLEYLMRHAGQVVTRTMLLEAAWDYDFEPRGNIIDMHVYRLRQKIDQGFSHPLIHTVQGAGYVIREASEPRANPSSTAPTPTIRSDPASAPRKP
jgi:two-component system OmpR family response regulator